MLDAGCWMLDAGCAEIIGSKNLLSTRAGERIWYLGSGIWNLESGI